MTLEYKHVKNFLSENKLVRFPSNFHLATYHMKSQWSTGLKSMNYKNQKAWV